MEDLNAQNPIQANAGSGKADASTRNSSKQKTAESAGQAAGQAAGQTGRQRGLDLPFESPQAQELPKTQVAVAVAPPKAESKKQKPFSEKSAKSGRGFSVLKFGLGLTFNLIGLGVAGGVGVLGGMAIAHFLPGSSGAEEPPLLERVFADGGRAVRGVGQLPKTAAKRVVNRLDPPAKPQLEAAAPIISQGQQQQIGNEVAALQNELAQMNVRAAALEAQLGYQYSDAAMELRLEALAQTVANPTAGPQSVANRDRARQPLLVTLPMDPLFDDDQSALKPASTALLGAIVSELRSYPAGVVTIGAHTDDVGAGTTKRDLSLRRAQAVAGYLQGQVGDSSSNVPSNRFLWNLVGYGDAEPLVPNESNANRQRNRRLEIRVTPR